MYEILRICIYVDNVTGNHEGNEGKKVKLQNIFTAKQKQYLASYMVGIFYNSFNYILIPYHILIPQYNPNSFYLIKMCDIPSKNSLAVKKGAAKQSRIKT